MRVKPFLISAVLSGCLLSTAGATSMQEYSEFDLIPPVVSPYTTRASNSFSMTVAKKSTARASSGFPMSAGESVRINVSYTPNGSVDFGLVDSNGIFHYFNVTGGSADKTIDISKKGTYTLQIRNNTSNDVTVTGIVTY